MVVLQCGLSSGRAVCPPDSCRLIFAARDRWKAGHRLEVIEVHGIADVLTRRLLERLEIPGLDLTLAQRGVDEPAPALAIADSRIQFGEVPALADFGAKVGDDAPRMPDRPRGCRARRGSRLRSNSWSGSTGEWMNLYAPRRIMTSGAIAPSARYSPIASSCPPAPRRWVPSCVRRSGSRAIAGCRPRARSVSA